MSRMTRTFVRAAFCVAALMGVSAEFANAAPARVAIGTNLREGPGLGFGVIATVQAGSVVDVIRCGAQWCNVMWGGRPGYMVARNLGIGGPAPVRIVQPAPAPVVVVGPRYYRPYYYGPRYYGPRYYGPRRAYYGRGYYDGPRPYYRRW
jgi:uncharacterized protein YraI